MQEFNDLPQDIIYEIFFRIPAEFLITLKSVCKLWQTIITDDQDFANAHLNRHRHSGEDYHHNHFLVRKVRREAPYDEQYELISSLQYVNSNGSVGTKFQVKLDLPQLVELLQGEPIYFHCFCDGLLLYHNTRKNGRELYEKKLYVCNPVTRKCTILPILKTDHKVDIRKWTLVHDASIHNYKVIGISQFTGECFIFTPYNSNSNSNTVVAAPAHWRRLVTPYPRSSPGMKRTLINNDLYWLSSHYHYGLDEVFLCSIHISKEDFRVTPVPFLTTSYSLNQIIEVMGSVCITDYNNNGHFNCQLDIWTLQDKMTSLWTKTYTFTLNQFRQFGYESCVSFQNYPSSQCSSQARLLICNRNQIFILDLKNRHFTRIEFPEFPLEYRMGTLTNGNGHINSLVNSQAMIGPHQKIQNETRSCTSKKVYFKSIWCSIIIVLIGIWIQSCFIYAI